MSPIFRSRRPVRYGYMSVRSGSHRWTWASTMRSISAAIWSSLVTSLPNPVVVPPRSGQLLSDHASHRAVDPSGNGGTSEGDRRSRSRVTPEPQPPRSGDQLRSGEGAGLRTAHEVRHQLGDGPALVLVCGLDADRERVDPVRGRGVSRP